LVPQKPDVVAATDTSKHGIGGFWNVPSTTPATPYPEFYAWCTQFTPDIQDTLVSPQNPAGSLIKDLELMSLIIGAMLASQSPTMAHPNVFIALDNTPAIAWTQKGSTTSIKALAYLLHHLAHLCHANPFTLTTLYVAGSSNLIADSCSCSFHMDDTTFLTHLITTFLVQPSWQLAQPSKQLPSNMNSSLFGTLCKQEYTATNVKDKTWFLWEDFYVQLQCGPELVGIDDPIPLLQLFAQ
jgi:hypothetical protein